MTTITIKLSNGDYIEKEFDKNFTDLNTFIWKMADNALETADIDYVLVEFANSDIIHTELSEYTEFFDHVYAVKNSILKNTDRIVGCRIKLYDVLWKMVDLCDNILGNLCEDCYSSKIGE